MRFVPRLAVALVLATLISDGAAAQFSSSSSMAVVAPTLEGDPYCFDGGVEDGTSSSALVCSVVVAVPNGTGSASSTSDYYARTGSAFARISQTGAATVDAGANGFTTMSQYVYLAGNVNPGDRLAFYLSLSGYGQLSGIATSAYGGYGVQMYGDNGFEAFRVAYYGCGCGEDLYQENVEEIGDGIWKFYGDVEDYYSFGLFNFDIIAFANVAMYEEIEGIDGESFMSFELLAIDLENSQGGVRGSAVFGDYQDGSGDIFFEDEEASVPEPASLILVGTGLLAVVGVARRRRAA